MKTPLFTGACTALVTPFLDGKINYPMLSVLLQRQMDAGIEAVVLSGTTGESPTLSDSEKLEMVRFAKAFCGDGCIIIAGTGSNATDHAVRLSQEAEEAGADALLVVTPYYNKGTEEGLFLHFSAIAAAVHIPIILYNVPSRTGVDLSVSLCRRLAQIPNISGIKEASTDMGKILKLRTLCPEDFCIWSGNDDLTVPVLSLGGKGVISVASNVLPEQVQAMAKAALAGDFDSASALQIWLQPLTELLFSEVNPVPVKTAMGLLGYACGECRLPLSPMTPENVRRLKNLLSSF